MGSLGLLILGLFKAFYPRVFFSGRGGGGQGQLSAG